MKGMTVQLVQETVTGYDPFKKPIVSETLIDVEDVLVGQPSSDDITNTIELNGRKIAYILGIPKGDTHDWVNKTVIIWGERYKTIGFPERGITDNIPLRWGQNIKVERYEQS